MAKVVLIGFSTQYVDVRKTAIRRRSKYLLLAPLFLQAAEETVISMLACHPTQGRPFFRMQGVCAQQRPMWFIGVRRPVSERLEREKLTAALVDNEHAICTGLVLWAIVRAVEEMVPTLSGEDRAFGCYSELLGVSRLYRVSSLKALTVHGRTKTLGLTGR